jgi:lipid II:glycine glycyltransferase (peptidoglycan interpeptide bridge formation enzyme)
MGIFDRIKDQRTASRIEEEWLYQTALKEIESGQRRPGLWAKALAETSGDESAAKAAYLKLLVQRFKDEAHIEKRNRQKELRDLAQEQERLRRKAQEESANNAAGEKAKNTGFQATQRSSNHRKSSAVPESLMLVLAGIIGFLSLAAIMVLIGRG